MKPENYRELLQDNSDAKTVKGTKYGYLTGICYLAPAEESGITNLCQFSTEGCRAGCLYKSGLSTVFPKIQLARIDKTRFLVESPEAFNASLAYDIDKLERKAAKLGLTPAVRINGTSDVPKLATSMAKQFPNVQFYDYTKIPKPWLRTLPNYDITFSLSETNKNEALEALSHGVNVAAVFHVAKSKPLPDEFLDYPVIDGDTSDLRFTDPRGVIVGLRAKGIAKKDTSGFVQITPTWEIPVSGGN